MATYNLMNCVKVKGLQLFAGDQINDAAEDITAIQSAGGVLIATGNAKLDAAASRARDARKYKGADEDFVNQVMAAAFNDAATKAVGMQSGRATLAAGTVTVSGVVLTASSRIMMSMADPGAGAITGFVELVTPDAQRNVGAGSFRIDAIDAAKAVVNTMVSTIDWIIVG
jgi:hypothetical protein